MHRWRDRLGTWAALCAAARVLSCGGEESPATKGTSDPDEGLVFSQVVTAADGGTVATDRGWATLTVPAGALVEDTEVFLTPGRAQGGSVTSVYDVDPAELAFDPAATLAIVYDGDPGPDRTVVLARLGDDGSWKDVGGSGLGQGQVSGPVAAGGRYAGVLRTIAGTSIDCAATWAAFQACGGAIEGTWHQQATCLQGAPFPLAAPAYCADRSGTWSLAQVGTVAIDAASETTYLSQDARSAEFEAPLSCFEDGASCGDVASMDTWTTTCREAGSATCRCTGLEVRSPGAIHPNPLRIDGSDLVMLDDDGTETGRKPFCVSGDVAVIRDAWTPPDGGDPVPVLRVLAR